MTEFLKGPVLTLSPVHETMQAEVGIPALLKLGQPFPGIGLFSQYDGFLTGNVLRADGSVELELPGQAIRAEEAISMQIAGGPAQLGCYQIQLKFSVYGRPDVYSSIWFTVLPATDQLAQLHPAVATGSDGRLIYFPDYCGNRVPDFSNAGYQGGGVKLPQVRVKLVLEPRPGQVQGDDTERIQAAIDELAGQTPDEDGYRGALLLKKGTYVIFGTLRISASGIVLRGEGPTDDGTILLAAGIVKRNLIEIKGEPTTVDAGRKFPVITDLYVPVGARSFHVDSAEGFTTGDTILVRREGNSDFIREISMDSIKPRPGSPDGTKQWEPFALEFDRVITAIDGNLITIDAQVAAAIESRWGGGSVLPYTDAGRIEQVGVENLKAVAEYDSSVVLRQGEQEYYGDEQHALGFVLFDHVKNAWVQNFAAFHFSFFTVHVDRGAKWVTVQKGETRDMVSVITGGRRYPYFISGQLSLFRNARAETARHAFVVGSRVCGPNVFLSGVSTQNYGSSEPHHRWSVGGLFDQIEGSIAIQDRQYFGSGHGWSGANYVAWNTTGELVVQKPPTAHNWSFGHVGQKGQEAFPPREQGSFASFGQCMKPDSLYLQQLKERLGQQAVESLEE